MSPIWGTKNLLYSVRGILSTPYGVFLYNGIKVDGTTTMKGTVIKMLRLRELREENDLTQMKCAKIANISKNSYIRYENEERATPHNIIAIFSKYYNVSSDYILGLIDIPRKLYK